MKSDMASRRAAGEDKDSKQKTKVMSEQLKEDQEVTLRKVLSYGHEGWKKVIMLDQFVVDVVFCQLLLKFRECTRMGKVKTYVFVIWRASLYKDGFETSSISSTPYLSVRLLEGNA
ncbi:hypothetical protein CTI12_AA338850 [Artemisia annua]|uniref:Uncharacterized protein n=1 Tax=Artemisia annua TaxID=35608 RepID=A0A2U1MTZ8_ARTAN|nr:hypothetical protein CTI12_AA338850 [Artemisia annua]